jgi:hypothetical protein
VYTEITAILEWFYIQKVVSEYAKNILACMEITPKEYKRIWRIRQEYFAVYGEYANRHKREPISANFRPNPEKIVILITSLGMSDEQKTNSR